MQPAHAAAACLDAARFTRHWRKRAARLHDQPVLRSNAVPLPSTGAGLAPPPPLWRRARWMCWPSSPTRPRRGWTPSRPPRARAHGVEAVVDATAAAGGGWFACWRAGAWLLTWLLQRWEPACSPVFSHLDRPTRLHAQATQTCGTAAWPPGCWRPCASRPAWRPAWRSAAAPSWRPCGCAAGAARTGGRLAPVC